ncbi:dTDP-4-dehydrorhamnose reductase family protein [Neobacillus sp. SM06]|uniref:dTDP-4-dehydrorhamnose reductase family protein n=1 Tax=Neobacillus sp. SM06 TaxID=3422492 RepID=UPI003D2A4A66
MRLLILGGSGMAGHMILNYFRKKKEIEVLFTSRNSQEKDAIFLDAVQFDEVRRLIEKLRPDVIVNCIGLLNEQAARQLTDAICLNSLLPHLLTELADKYGGKVMQISTDCVFEGTKGGYTETDLPDGVSVYAKTKSLGEVTSGRHLTIRTSIIGPEKKQTGIGLFHWFMQQSGKINGYQNVLWNGVTTLELAKVIDQSITLDLSGLYHLTAPVKISKYELLLLLQNVFKKTDVEIVPDGKIVLDRTLTDTRKELPDPVPDYPEMITALSNWMMSNG